MTLRPAAFPIAFAMLLAVAGARAQNAPPTTDFGPAPAEERASTGAVVIVKTPVPALRDQVLQTDSARMGAAPSTAADTAIRTPAPTRAQARAAKERARSAAADRLRRSGAGR